MADNEIISDGKEKRICATGDPGMVCIHYKDFATAFGGVKQATIKNKGKYVNRISAITFEALGKAGIATRFISMPGEREQLCRRVEPVPLQFIVRNRLAGTTAQLLGVRNGTPISNVICEIRYKCEELGCPMINEDHAVALDIVSEAEIAVMKKTAVMAGKVLKALFHEAGIELVDFKMEFGRTSDGAIIVSTGVSPDNSRLWDEQTGDILDKDRFRHDLGKVGTAYREVMERLIKITEQ